MGHVVLTGTHLTWNAFSLQKEFMLSPSPLFLWIFGNWKPPSFLFWYVHTYYKHQIIVCKAITYKKLFVKSIFWFILYKDYIYTGWSKKTPTTLSMLCRMANWSLFKEKPMSGNARCGRSRTSKLENWCHNWLQFVLVSWTGMQPFSYRCDRNNIPAHALFLHFEWGMFCCLRVQWGCWQHSTCTSTQQQKWPTWCSHSAKHIAMAELLHDCMRNIFQTDIGPTPHHSSFAAIERWLREAGKFHVCTLQSNLCLLHVHQ